MYQYTHMYISAFAGPVFKLLGKLKQEDGDFVANLGNSEKSCFRKIVGDSDWAVVVEYLPAICEALDTSANPAMWSSNYTPWHLLKGTENLHPCNKLYMYVYRSITHKGQNLAKLWYI